MAKRAAITAAPIVPTKIKLTTWGSGQTMYRVHDAIYAVDQFNPSPKGNARFSPILDPSGKVIPTLYAATTPRGALMESVFRDIPYRTGFKHVDARRLAGRVCSTLVVQDRLPTPRSEQGRPAGTWYSSSAAHRHDQGALPRNAWLGRASVRCSS